MELGGQVMEVNQTRHGIDVASYHVTMEYALQPSGGWQEVGGSRAASGSGSRLTTESGSGEYWEHGPECPPESPGDHYGTGPGEASSEVSYQYHVDGVLGADGDWTETGSLQSSAAGTADYSYSGSGGGWQASGYGNVGVEEIKNWELADGTWSLTLGIWSRNYRKHDEESWDGSTDSWSHDVESSKQETDYTDANGQLVISIQQASSHSGESGAGDICATSELGMYYDWEVPGEVPGTAYITLDRNWRFVSWSNDA